MRYAPSIHSLSTINTHDSPPPAFVIIILRVTDYNHYRRAFIMPKKVSVKPILELGAAGISIRRIKA